MNIFRRMMMDETARIGNPLGIGTGPFYARMNRLATATGGRGFRMPARGVKISKNGTTRKQREAHIRPAYLKRLAVERAFRESRYAAGWRIAEVRDAIERGDHLKS